MTSFLLLNGPNLNLLGTREPGIYGTATLEDIVGEAKAYAAARGAELADFQSNAEGDLINALHAARGRHECVILNPGAYTHTSVALMDAIAATGLPVVEVHLSNIHARESFRRDSLISPVAVGVIAGFGAFGYLMAIDAGLNHLKAAK